MGQQLTSIKQRGWSEKHFYWMEFIQSIRSTSIQNRLEGIAKESPSLIAAYKKSRNKEFGRAEYEEMVLMFAFEDHGKILNYILDILDVDQNEEYSLGELGLVQEFLQYLTVEMDLSQMGACSKESLINCILSNPAYKKAVQELGLDENKDGWDEGGRSLELTEGGDGVEEEGLLQAFRIKQTNLAVWVNGATIFNNEPLLFNDYCVKTESKLKTFNQKISNKRIVKGKMYLGFENGEICAVGGQLEVSWLNSLSTNKQVLQIDHLDNTTIAVVGDANNSVLVYENDRFVVSFQTESGVLRGIQLLENGFLVYFETRVIRFQRNEKVGQEEIKQVSQTGHHQNYFIIVQQFEVLIKSKECFLFTIQINQAELIDNFLFSYDQQFIIDFEQKQ